MTTGSGMPGKDTDPHRVPDQTTKKKVVVAKYCATPPGLIRSDRNKGNVDDNEWGGKPTESIDYGVRIAIYLAAAAPL